jgi:hypothetical protein
LILRSGGRTRQQVWNGLHQYRSHSVNAAEVKGNMSNRTITKFDKDSFTVLRPVIEKAVQDVLAPYGLKANLGNIKYTESSFTGKLEVQTANDGERSYQRLAQLYPNKLKPEWFRKTFTSKGEQYRIVGADLGRCKFDIATVRVSDGRPFGFPHDAIFRAFDPEAAKKAERAEYERNLRFISVAQSCYPNITASLLGAEVVMGGKIIGLSDTWIGPRTQIIVERQDGTLGAVRAKDFGPAYLRKPGAAA